MSARAKFLLKPVGLQVFFFFVSAILFDEKVVVSSYNGESDKKEHGTRHANWVGFMCEDC